MLLHPFGSLNPGETGPWASRFPGKHHESGPQLQVPEFRGNRPFWLWKSRVSIPGLPGGVNHHTRETHRFLHFKWTPLEVEYLGVNKKHLPRPMKPSEKGTSSTHECEVRETETAHGFGFMGIHLGHFLAQLVPVPGVQGSHGSTPMGSHFGR